MALDLADFAFSVHWIENGNIVVPDIEGICTVLITDHIEPDWTILDIEIDGHIYSKGSAAFDRIRGWIIDQETRRINDMAVSRAWEAA